MTAKKSKPDAEEIELENREWLESLEDVYRGQGRERVRQLLRRLQFRAGAYGVGAECSFTTPYVNTIPVARQAVFPGSREIERRIKSIIRWNAMAMVVRANRRESGIGGHISTYASCATLFEVGFNHFFRAKSGNHPGDIIYFQGHAAPGVYARAFLEGRISETQLENFRRECQPAGGLSSYPHPYLLPGFWQVPTVSMGLSPIMSIYQARFARYLADRGLKPPDDQRVWAFLGDGEMDEPESLGAVTLAARENLDNLIFVINCNLQRLDGPVRGNGKIIQELETVFLGAGWNVIKVIWGGDWDPLLAGDEKGLLVRRMEEVPDGQYQLYSATDGAFIRKDFFGKYPELLEMVRHYTDEQLWKLRRGGHDPEKVYAAYHAAVNHNGSPTVILAKTIKGYGLGEAGEGRNVTHQQKKLNEEELRHFRSRFGIPIPDDKIGETPFYRPAAESEEMRYLENRRSDLGGYVPKRRTSAAAVTPAGQAVFDDLMKGTGDRQVATTMAMVQLLGKLLADKACGKYIVPIIPDEARTFGMESLFRKYGIYSHLGQHYEPVDKDTLLYYKEAQDGQILEEGITEAGSVSSFIAAGTAYSTYGIRTVPFFFFYSMFGFQRIGDLLWAAGDARARGFLVGATSGRTTLAGEGLQHQDGHSHVLALGHPSVRAYDPAFAYEIAVIVREGLRRILVEEEDLIYYLTVTNEFYPMPAMPEGAEEGILKGLYKFRTSGNRKTKLKAHLLAGGAIMNEALGAQVLLENDFGVAADVWSVTSYKNLYWDAIGVERDNLRHPRREAQLSHIGRQLANETGVFVAVSDYLKALPAMIAKWVPGDMMLLGTDGYGRSDSRSALRDFFEVDARHIAYAALGALLREKRISLSKMESAAKKLDIDSKKADPLFS
ncbi:MAG: pyruvate dehydrogenase (acetyl-transferring), homodimeric type [Desulfobacterales bacterium]|jgi:pyruvate dehydrogenase E1 component|nr:pyruvate dehydrogenase (acetyl-transferring), homodimeric type [Desulfobacterales bacterium]